MRILLAGLVFIAAAAAPICTIAHQSQIPLSTLTTDLRITESDVPSTEIVTSVTSLSVAPDGMIFSADQGEGRVRVHDTNGKFVRAFGSKGEGPKLIDD